MLVAVGQISFFLFFERRLASFVRFANCYIDPSPAQPPADQHVFLTYIMYITVYIWYFLHILGTVAAKASQIAGSAPGRCPSTC